MPRLENECGEEKRRGKKFRFNLKKSRELYLFTEISNESIQELVEDIRELDAVKKKSPIHLFIHSPGGDMASGFALIDVIQGCKCPVYTYALGEICSMAPAIFVAGTKRFISRHTYVMLHPVSCGAIDYVEFAKSRIRNAEAAEKMYDSYFKERTKLPRKLYEKAKYTELWLTAEEAIKYKIADGYYEGKHDNRTTA